MDSLPDEHEQHLSGDWHVLLQLDPTQFGLEATVKYILANGEARACVYLCQIQREVVSVTLVHHLESKLLAG